MRAITIPASVPQIGARRVHPVLGCANGLRFLAYQIADQCRGLMRPQGGARRGDQPGIVTANGRNLPTAAIMRGLAGV